MLSDLGKRGRVGRKKSENIEAASASFGFDGFQLFASNLSVVLGVCMVGVC
jgi:hypothetical protein